MLPPKLAIMLAERIQPAPIKPNVPKCCSFPPSKPAYRIAQTGSVAKISIATEAGTVDCPFICRATPTLQGPIAGMRRTPQLRGWLYPPHKDSRLEPWLNAAMASFANHAVDSSAILAS